VKTRAIFDLFSGQSGDAGSASIESAIDRSTRYRVRDTTGSRTDLITQPRKRLISRAGAEVVSQGIAPPPSLAVPARPRIEHTAHVSRYKPLFRSAFNEPRGTVCVSVRRKDGSARTLIAAIPISRDRQACRYFLFCSICRCAAPLSILPARDSSPPLLLETNPSERFPRLGRTALANVDRSIAIRLNKQ